MSPEFYAVLKSGNLIRARIILKDALIVDMSFQTFDALLAQAKKVCPNIVVPYDGGELEEDRSKWDRNGMDMELVEIVNNFSEERIRHLKRVIRVVMADKIKTQSPNASCSSPNNSHRVVPQGRTQPTRISFTGPTDDERRKQRILEKKRALSQITNSSVKINKAMANINAKGVWSDLELRQIEAAANQILISLRNYKRIDKEAQR